MRMLDKALQAVYPQDVVGEVPLPAYRKYFAARHNDRSGSCQVAAEARALVHFT
jgi:chemotaxis methyl-accepting protein methylase